jgi:hypothetical protein
VVRRHPLLPLLHSFPSSLGDEFERSRRRSASSPPPLPSPRLKSSTSLLFHSWVRSFRTATGHFEQRLGCAEAGDRRQCKRGGVEIDGVGMAVGFHKEFDGQRELRQEEE